MAAHSDFAHSVHSAATASRQRRYMARTARRAHSQSRLLKFMPDIVAWAAPERTGNLHPSVPVDRNAPER